VVAFLPGETKPRFMWATLVDEGSYMTFDAQDLFPTSERYESKITIHHNAWTDAGLGYGLHVYFAGRTLNSLRPHHHDCTSLFSSLAHHPSSNRTKHEHNLSSLPR
jgi:hypothetical protein